MKTSIKTITPKIAEEMLKKNDLNRLLKPLVVNDYARQMSAGLWKEDTAESIKIATDGTLLDGQHRLNALLKANVTLTFLVAEGMDKEIFLVLDQQAKRTPGDVFHIAGVQNARTLAGGIKAYFFLKAGRTSFVKVSNQITSAELFTIYSKRSKFWDAAATMSLAWYHKSKRIMTAGVFISLYAFFYDIDQDDAFLFMENLSGGANLDSSDPIFLLREKLIFAKVNPKFSLLPSVRTAYILKAWNSFRRREKVKQLRYNPELDNYPVAV